MSGQRTWVVNDPPGHLRRAAKRRVIQIAITTAGIGGGDTDTTILALCDDSTVWWSDFSTPGWHALEPVPGTVAEEAE